MPKMSVIWIVWVAWLASSVLGHADYRMRKETADPKAVAVVEAMENVAIREVTLKDATLAKALDELNRLGTAGKGGGVVNFVIRRPRRAGGGGAPEKKITLHLKATNFAAALDAACAQSGYRWSVAFNEKSGGPLVVIER
jgi:hypothetical protein